MFLITLIRKNIDNIKIKWYEIILFLLSAIYASNQEQMSVVLFCIFALYLLMNLKNKKLKFKTNKIITYIVFGIILIELIVALTCPRKCF